SEYQGNIMSWIASLLEWKNWEVIDYKIEPIFNLLDNHQRDRIIKKIVVKRILKKDIIPINESNIKDSYHLRSLKINSDNDKLKLTLVYNNNEHKLLIHCIEGNKNEFNLEEPKFKRSEHIKKTDTIQVDSNDFPLITCMQDLPLDDCNKYIVLGVTFSKVDDKSEACIFTYNVKSRQLDKIDD
ncbi:19430_t:CDS:2, partial [Gigaspora margarita]